MSTLKLNHLLITVVISLLSSSTSAQLTMDVENKFNSIEDSILYYPSKVKASFHSEYLPTKRKDHPRYGEIQYLKALLYYQEGKIDSSLKYIDEAFYSLIKSKNKKWQGRCHLLLGWISERSGYWEEAIVNYFECIKLTKNSNKLNGLAYLGIARCKKFLDEPYKNYLNKSLDHLYKTNKSEFKLLADFSTKIFDLSGENTMKELRRIADNYLDLGLKNNALDVYKKIGEYYVYEGKLDSTLFYLNKAISLHDEQYPGISLLPNLMQFKAGVFFLQKKYRKAENLYLKTISLCDKYKQKNFKHYPLKYLSRIDTINGDFKSAFKRTSIANKIKDKLRVKEKQRMAKIAETTAKVRNLENQFFSLKKQSQIKSIVFGSIGIIALLGGTFLFYWIKNREKEKQEKINKKNKELQNLIIGLNEKKLAAFKTSGLVLKPEEIEKSLNEKSLKEQFDICYHENIVSFKQEFSSLSHVEATYALMFALNLSPELIAEIQSIQLPAIRKAKQRIRKKLELDRNCNLELYFFNFYQKYFPNQAIQKRMRIEI